MLSPALGNVDLTWAPSAGGSDSLDLANVDLTWAGAFLIPTIVAEADSSVVFHTSRHSSTAQAIPRITARVKASKVFTSEEHAVQIGAVGGRLSVRQSAAGTNVFSTGIHAVAGAGSKVSFVVRGSDVVSYGTPSTRMAVDAASHDVFQSGAHAAGISSSVAAGSDVVQHAQHAARMAVRPWPAGPVTRFGLPSIARNEL
jgi:hypothetical protein